MFRLVSYVCEPAHYNLRGNVINKHFISSMEWFCRKYSIGFGLFSVKMHERTYVKMYRLNNSYILHYTLLLVTTAETTVLLEMSLKEFR